MYSSTDPVIRLQIFIANLVNIVKHLLCTKSMGITLNVRISIEVRRRVTFMEGCDVLGAGPSISSSNLNSKNDCCLLYR